MVTLSAQDIAVLCRHDPQYYESQLHQTEHRIAIVSKWGVENWEGAKVLEVGCGQGDCTAVLAEAVGPNGHVTAVDPGPLDYGNPFTLGQAQEYLSSGRLGQRITWKQADPVQLLQEDSTQYDVAVLAHCLWYFSSTDAITETLRLVSTRAKKICIAEWSLSMAPARPHNTHVLAVLAQAALECRKVKSESNVRTVVSPAGIKSLARDAGLVLERECTVTPAATVRDGVWETTAVVAADFEMAVQEHVKDGRERALVLALRDATVSSVAGVEGGAKAVLPMDVWTGVFTSSA